jgi:hypothetical protein
MNPGSKAQPNRTAAQSKTARATPGVKATPVVPPVYRPNAAPASPQPRLSAPGRPATPPVYGPARPRAAQAKPATIQRYTGPIPSSGLSAAEIKELVERSETTMFDMGGHMIKKHGQQSTAGNKPNFTKFDKNSLAARTIAKGLEEGRSQINGWLESTTEKYLELEVAMDEALPGSATQLGSGTVAGVAVAGLTTAMVILAKKEVPDAKKPAQRARDTEWYVKTAYPKPND